MELISDMLRSDIHKFKDIFNIMLKLDEDGAVKEICNLFYKIFSNESKFTLGELVRIQKERSEKINIGRQYENNLSLFKSNFNLIIQLIADNTFKIVTKENQENLKEKQERLPTKTNESELEQPAQVESLVTEETPARKKPESNQLKLNLHNSNKTSISNQPKSARRESSQSNSKTQSAFQQIINGGSQCRTSRESFSTKEHEKDLSVTRSQQYSLSKRNSMQVSSPAKSSHLEALKTPVSSDFNYVQGSATFSQGPRKFLDINLNGPGPAFYDVDRANSTTFHRPVSPTIGKAQKQTWIDTMTKTNSPGPGGLYPSMHFVAK